MADALEVISYNFSDNSVQCVTVVADLQKNADLSEARRRDALKGSDVTLQLSKQAKYVLNFTGQQTDVQLLDFCYEVSGG